MGHYLWRKWRMWMDETLLPLFFLYINKYVRWCWEDEEWILFYFFNKRKKKNTCWFWKMACPSKSMGHYLWRKWKMWMDETLLPLFFLYISKYVRWCSEDEEWVFFFFFLQKKKEKNNQYPHPPLPPPFELNWMISVSLYTWWFIWWTILGVIGGVETNYFARASM